MREIEKNREVYYLTLPAYPQFPQNLRFEHGGEDASNVNNDSPPLNSVTADA